MEPPEVSTVSAAEVRLGVARWAAVVAAFFLLYGLTAQRGVNWQDSGLFQYRILRGDYEGWMGLALAHPLYIALGRAALRLGGPEHLPLLTNLLSALAMAVAMGNLAALATRLAGRRRLAILLAGMVGLAHTVWWLATISETYPWSAAGLTGELLLLVSLLRRPRPTTAAGLFLLNGLGWCLHNLALLPLPVYGVALLALLVRRRLPLWSLAASAGAYLIGASMFLTMIVAQALREGDWLGAISSALVGDFGKDVANVAGVSKFWKENAVLSALNFCSPLGPLAVAGWWHFRRRLGGPTAAALGAVTAIETVFFIRYPVPDQFMFLLPTLMTFAAAAAVGLAEAAAGKTARRMVLGLCLLSLPAQPALYATAPYLARTFRGAPPPRQPFRDEWRYWLTPWKHNEDSADRFCRAVLESVETHALLILDRTALSPLRVYQEAQDQRRDVRTIEPSQWQKWRTDSPSVCEELLRSGRVYVRPAPSEPAAAERFSRGARFQPVLDGVLYRVALP